MIQVFVGYLMLIMGVAGLLFNKNIDHLLQMMENSAAIVSALACLVGMLAIALTPTKKQATNQVTDVEIIEDENIVASDKIHEIQREDPKKRSGVVKESRTKFGRQIPKDIKGVIIDT